MRSVLGSVVFGRQVIQLTLVPDHTVYVWNFESGNVEKKLVGHDDGVYSASFSPNGKWIVSGSHGLSSFVVVFGLNPLAQTTQSVFGM